MQTVAKKGAVEMFNKLREACCVFPQRLLQRGDFSFKRVEGGARSMNLVIVQMSKRSHDRAAPRFRLNLLKESNVNLCSRFCEESLNIRFSHRTK